MILCEGLLLSLALPPCRPTLLRCALLCPAVVRKCEERTRSDGRATRVVSTMRNRSAASGFSTWREFSQDRVRRLAVVQKAKGARRGRG